MEDTILKEDGDSGKTRPSGIILTAENVTEESKAKAEAVKEKANSFFKSNIVICTLINAFDIIFLHFFL